MNRARHLRWPPQPSKKLESVVYRKGNPFSESAFAKRPETTEFALDLREKLKAVMAAYGSCHVQIAKAYDYLGTREPRVAALLKDIKASVDPHNRVNPGSLGLGV